MPIDPRVLGFANRWYPEAVESAMEVRLTQDLVIRIASAPAFVATKFEAFSTRGRNDLMVAMTSRTSSTSSMAGHRSSWKSKLQPQRFATP